MTIMREERAQDAHDLDNVTYNLAVVVALLAVGSVLLFRVKLGTPRGVGARPRPSVTLRGWGVPLRRVKSALRELERKTFHLCGLLVPLIHLALLEGGFRQRTCIFIAWAITSIGWSADLARLHIPFVARHWPLQTILRDHEHEQLTGGCYFSLGCTLAMTVFSRCTNQVSRLARRLVDLCVRCRGDGVRATRAPRDAVAATVHRSPATLPCTPSTRRPLDGVIAHRYRAGLLLDAGGLRRARRLD